MINSVILNLELLGILINQNYFHKVSVQGKIKHEDEVIIILLIYILQRCN